MALRTVELTAWRATVRRWLPAGIALFAALGAVGYVLPAHRLVYVPSSGGWLDLLAQPGEESFHSNFADGGPFPLVAFTVVIATSLLLRRRGFGAGMLAGIVGAAGAILALGPVLLVHLLSATETAYGDHIFAMGVIGTFIGGAALLLVEPVVYLLERRRILKASRPAPLPTAIINER